MTRRRVQRGAVMVISMIFIAIFAVLAMSMAAFSNGNVQVAVNQIQGNRARGCAESGLQVIRYWLGRVTLSGTLPADERLQGLVDAVQTELEDQGITTFAPSLGGGQITIPSITLNSADGERFAATISQPTANVFQVEVTGTHGQVSRKIGVRYDMTTKANTVFDFGVATKGPLSLIGSIEVVGVNLSVESNAYIESMDDWIGLTMQGPAEIAGEVKIVNPSANPDIGKASSVGGEKGKDALDHVYVGVPACEFPEPDPDRFEAYATTVMDAGMDTSSDVVLQNVRIPADMNPHFSGQATLLGVVFIEQPNVVKFSGRVNSTAIIVGDGDWTDDSGSNQIIFTGNVSSQPVSTLPDTPQFAGIRDEIGTFLMAPGFDLTFQGSFSTLSGAIAGNGIEFSGNAGGTIRGSVINYANKTMELSGNTELKFNRSGLDSLPSGFQPRLYMVYNTGSYSEPTL